MAGDGLIRSPQFSASDPPSFAVGGDLSGTSANAVVARINGATVPTEPVQSRLLGKGASEVGGLTYLDGDFDASSGAVRITALQGYAVQNHAPVDGEVLTWVAGSSQWEPQPAGGGGVSSWNAMYAADPNSNVLTVSGAADPFEISQTSTTGSAFYVRRNLSSGNTNAPVVHFINQAGNPADDQYTLLVERTDGFYQNLPILQCKDTAGNTYLNFSTNGVLFIQSVGSAADQYCIDAVQNGGAGNLVRLRDGATNRWVMNQTGNIVHSVADNTQCVGISSAITNVAGDYAGVDLTVAHTVDLTQDGKDVYGMSVAVPSRAGDDSTAQVEHAAYRAHFTGGTIPTGGNVWPVGFSAASGLLLGMRSQSPVLVDADPPATLPVVIASIYSGSSPSTNQLLFCATGTITSPTQVLGLRADGKMEHTVAAALGTAYRLYDTTNSKERVTFDASGQSSFLGARDAAFTAAFRIENEWSSVETGLVFEAISNKSATAVSAVRVFNSGMTEFHTHSAAPSTAVPVINLWQEDVSEGFINFSGDENADQAHSISTSQGDGSNVVGPFDKTTSIGWAFHRMVQVQVKGTPCWICAYLPAV